jgi:cytochrome oxidase Cu insertion factor (SCO1/SenC/PrrC family)
MNRTLLFWLATLFVLGGGMLIWTLLKTPDGHSPEAQAVVEQELTEFELIDQMGNRVNSRELAGHVWAGSFFFASCPSTCYNQNIKLQQLHARYADRGLRLVSITCDPGNDTPVSLAGYASRFNADPNLWKFLTPADGDMQYITRIANDFFGVAVGPETHTDRVVLFDRAGKILGAYSVLNAKQYRELDQQIEQALATPAEAVNEQAAESTEGEHAAERAASETPVDPNGQDNSATAAPART